MQVFATVTFYHYNLYRLYIQTQSDTSNLEISHESFSAFRSVSRFPDQPSTDSQVSIIAVLFYPFLMAA